MTFLGWAGLVLAATCVAIALVYDPDAPRFNLFDRLNRWFRR